MKTKAPMSARVRQTLTATEFAALPAPANVDQPGQKERATRFPDALPNGLREGDMVSVIGWVQIIKTSLDDCDYHIQITPTKAGTSGTIILEIPAPDPRHVTSAALRTLLVTTRQTIKRQLNLTREPGTNRIRGRAYMEFRGALFFDGSHYPHCDERGNDAPAVTCWEIHPVTKTAFVPRPPS